VAVWSTETGKLLCHLERKCPVGFGPFPYNDGATCLSFSSDGGLIAVVGADGQVTVHCTGFGGGRPKEVSRFQGTEPVLFGPDGTWLLTGRSDGEFQRISAGSGELLRRYKAPRSKQFSEVFAWELSPDCRVALCYSSGLPVIDLETGHVLFEAGGLPWRVWASFSPDGQRLAAPGRNGLLHIWDLGTRTVITELPVSAAFMRFTTDGDYLIVISPEGRLAVLDGRSFRGPQKHGP
jgi:WD40 repeat protein